jgi:hypothetical protein
LTSDHLVPTSQKQIIDFPTIQKIFNHLVKCWRNINFFNAFCISPVRNDDVEDSYRHDTVITLPVAKKINSTDATMNPTLFKIHPQIEQWVDKLQKSQQIIRFMYNFNGQLFNTVAKVNSPILLHTNRYFGFDRGCYGVSIEGRYVGWDANFQTFHNNKIFMVTGRLIDGWGSSSDEDSDDDDENRVNEFPLQDYLKIPFRTKEYNALGPREHNEWMLFNWKYGLLNQKNFSPYEFRSYPQFHGEFGAMAKEPPLEIDDSQIPEIPFESENYYRLNFEQRLKWTINRWQQGKLEWEKKMITNEKKW